MPRQAQVPAADAPQHITPKGNNRQDVSLLASDRETCLTLLAEHSRLAHHRILGCVVSCLL